MSDPLVPAVIEMVDVALTSYFPTPFNRPTLTNPVEIHEAIWGLKVGKSSGPNGIPNRVLKHLPQRVVSSLAQMINGILFTHHYPTVLKHAQVISFLKPGTYSALTTSYRPIRLLDMIGKLF